MDLQSARAATAGDSRHIKVSAPTNANSERLKLRRHSRRSIFRTARSNARFAKASVRRSRSSRGRHSWAICVTRRVCWNAELTRCGRATRRRRRNSNAAGRRWLGRAPSHDVFRGARPVRLPARRSHQAASASRSRNHERRTAWGNLTPLSAQLFWRATNQGERVIRFDRACGEERGLAGVYVHKFRINNVDEARHPSGFRRLRIRYRWSRVLYSASQR
jgi:hypothetical protein